MIRQTPIATALLVSASLLGGCVGDIDAAGAPMMRGESTPAEVGDAYAITSANRLISFESATGEIVDSMDIVGLGEGDWIVGADFRPADSKLYALARSGKLYAFDLRRAGLVVRSTLEADPADTTSPFTGLEGDEFAVSFNPVADRLRVIGSGGQNLRVDVDTGAVTTDTALARDGAFSPAATYSNPFAAACRTQLFVLDRSSGELFLQDPPNEGTLTPLASVAGARGADAGLEIMTAENGRASAMVYLPSDAGASLFDVDIRTGELSSGRTLQLDADERVLAIEAPPPVEAPPQARGELLAVNAQNELVSFNRAAPGKLCTHRAIDGLEPNEGVLGIDVRPADGGLYALGSSGNIYALDTASGEATLRSSLRADASDTTAPFQGLDPRASYGVAFNPVPDRLRVVSRGGVNLRINVDTGVTNTDSPLSPANMAVPAVAYTNAVAGATSTTLYAIDSARGSLARIGGNPATSGACPDDAGNPNCGVVNDVGDLGMAGMSDVGGFDIDGSASTSVGWLALTLAPGTSSSLFAVDLATGAVSAPTGVADPTIGGGSPVRGLTLASGLAGTP
jgi:uncharacterized protein DUF4394